MVINKNLIYTLATQLVILMSGFLTSIFTAYYLGPAGRGEYFFITTLTTLVVQLGCLGMQTSNIYLISKSERALGALTSNVIWISIIIGTLSALAIFITFNILHRRVVGIEFIAILGPATLFYLLGVNLLIAINKVKFFNIFQIGSNIILGLVLLTCGLLGFGIKAFLIATSLLWVMISFLLIYVISRCTSIPFKFDYNYFKQGFSYSMKVYIVSLFAALVLKGNIFILSKFSSVTVLGYYSIASQICDALVIFPKTYSLLLLPDLIKKQENSWEKIQKSLSRSTIILVFVYLAVALLARWVIPIVFGSQFSPATAILLWMLPGSFFLGIISIASQFLAAHNFPKILVSFWFIGFLLMVIFSMILIPLFSGEGGAMAVSAASFLVLIMVVGYTYHFNQTLQKNLNLKGNYETIL